MLRDTYAVSTGAFIDVQKQNDDSSGTIDGGSSRRSSVSSSNRTHLEEETYLALNFFHVPITT